MTEQQPRKYVLKQHVERVILTLLQDLEDEGLFIEKINFERAALIGTQKPILEVDIQTRHY